MIKKMTIRIEFKAKNEKLEFKTLFKAEYLGSYYSHLNKYVADFTIMPIDGRQYFTDEEIEAFLLECDEKTKIYEIIGIEEI